MIRRQKKAARRLRKAKRQPLGREAWLEVARQALIEEGTAGIEVNKLAKRLGVTRGGFYWFFASREELLDEMVKQWADNSTEVFRRILKAEGHNGTREFQALVDLWIKEKEYDPKWDGAVRDWARTSASVLETVQMVDAKRISIIEQIFSDMGYEGAEAHVRARVTYYHQVGYYALGVQESRKQRLALLPYYIRVLAGDSIRRRD
jgi:AcrR family transcriptional regulator